RIGRRGRTGGRGPAAGKCSTARKCGTATTRRKHGHATARDSSTADREAGSNRRPCAELRAARDEAGGDTGTEDTEAEKRKGGQHDGHGVVNGRGRTAEACSELAEERRADADDDGQHQHLDAG